MIYNKSGHPIEVKKISVRIWSLRAEIEAAIGRRIKECEAAGVPLYIEDIKKIYNLELGVPLTEQSNVLQMPSVEKDGVTSLMESLGEDAKKDEDVPTEEIDPLADETAPAEVDPLAPEADPLNAAPSEADPLAPTPETSIDHTLADPTAVVAEGVVVATDSKTFNEAEAILAQQTKEGLENKQPNPILDRPYTRQAPDLDQISYGFAFLADMTMEHLLGFTKDKFLQGQSIVVEFLVPQAFKMSADIAYCNYYALRSKIISSTKPDYRVQCRFTFSHSGERDNLRKFLKSIEPTVAVEKKKKKVVEDDSLGL